MKETRESQEKYISSLIHDVPTHLPSRSHMKAVGKDWVHLVWGYRSVRTDLEVSSCPDWTGKNCR